MRESTQRPQRSAEDAERITPADQLGESSDALHELSGESIGCAMEVHRTLDPGLIERPYEEALCIEFSRRGLPLVRQRIQHVEYKGAQIGERRLDLVVSDATIVELKAVEDAASAHLAQLASYLKAGGFPLGILLNFNALRMKDGVLRRANARRSNHKSR